MINYCNWSRHVWHEVYIKPRQQSCAITAPSLQQRLHKIIYRWVFWRPTDSQINLKKKNYKKNEKLHQEMNKAIKHLNRYTRMFSVFQWGYNWILIHASVILSNFSNSSNWMKIYSFWKIKKKLDCCITFCCYSASWLWIRRRWRIFLSCCCCPWLLMLLLVVFWRKVKMQLMVRLNIFNLIWTIFKALYWKIILGTFGGNYCFQIWAWDWDWEGRLKREMVPTIFMSTFNFNLWNLKLLLGRFSCTLREDFAWRVA